MNKPITFEKNKFFLIRKAIGFSALLLGVICLCLILFGFIPLKNQQLSVVGAAKLFFEGMIDLNHSYWYHSFACVALTVIYFVFTIKTIKNIFQFIKSLRYWANNTVDSVEIREETRAMVDASSIILWRLIVLSVISYMFWSFSASFSFAFVLTLLIVVNVGMQAMQNVLYTTDLERGIYSSVGLGVILASIVVFAMTSFNVQAVDIFRVLKIAMNFKDGQMNLLLIVQNVLLPIIYIATLIFLLVLYPIELKKVSDSRKYADLRSIQENGKRFAKVLLIQNGILLVVWMVLSGRFNQYSEAKEYITMFFDHILLIIIPIMVYLCLKNAFDYAEDRLQPLEETIEETPSEE